MFRRRAFGSRSGIGMLEMVVASGMGIMLMVGFARMMKSTTSQARRADIKNDSSNFEVRLRNLLGEEASCKAVLVDGMTSKVFDPNKVLDPNDPVSFTPTLKMPEGSTVGKGGSVGSLKLGDLKLRVLGPMMPLTSGKFEGSLDFSAVQERDLAGGQLKARNLPVILLTSEAANNQREITGCYSRALQPKEICNTISGRWIDSISRCFFGGELKLDAYEGLDASEFEVGGALAGASVDTCFYKTGARTNQYRCINGLITSNRRYSTPRCEYVPLGGDADSAHSGWVVRDTVKNRFYFQCDAGVSVRIPEEDVRFWDSRQLNETTSIEGNDGSTPAPKLEQVLKMSDVLDNVVECYAQKHIGQDIRSLKCLQGDRALQGAGGSCVFVHNVPRSRRAGETGVKLYTGWVWVRPAFARRFIRGGTPGNYWFTVQEPLGVACEYVKVVGGDDDDPSIRVSTESESLPYLADDSALGQVQGCLFMGTKTDPGNDPSFSGWQVPGRALYRGGFVHQLACANETEDDEDDSANELTYPKPGSCYYVRNAILPAGFKGNWLGSGNTRAAYTGWVRVAATVPRNAYRISTTDNTLVRTAAKILLATPCNLGVRVEPGTDAGG